MIMKALLSERYISPIVLSKNALWSETLFKVSSVQIILQHFNTHSQIKS